MDYHFHSKPANLVGLGKMVAGENDYMAMETTIHSLCDDVERSLRTCLHGQNDIQVMFTSPSGIWCYVSN